MNRDLAGEKLVEIFDARGINPSYPLCNEIMDALGVIDDDKELPEHWNHRMIVQAMQIEPDCTDLDSALADYILSQMPDGWRVIGVEKESPFFKVTVFCNHLHYEHVFSVNYSHDLIKHLVIELMKFREWASRKGMFCHE